jgi:pimeloyl-ACP methyl ester carboxylesterase
LPGARREAWPAGHARLASGKPGAENGRVRRPLPALLAPAVAGVLVLAGAAPAAGAATFRPCGGDVRGVLCVRVAVPLDRSGATPGTVRLLVQRVAARPRRSQVLLVLVGGPGQAAVPLRDDIRTLLAPALRRRELVVFDQRGTGASDVLRCPSLEGEDIRDPARAAAACAARLGPRRAFYTTRDSIADVEAVREALGVERMALLAVSYGTKVALGYAIAHPDRVERLVLDSPVAVDGPDPFGRSGFAAVGRALGDVCRGRRCQGITGDPTRDLGTLAARLRAAPLRGRVIGRRGQRLRAALRARSLAELVFTSDIDPTLLAALPAAVRSALRGDAAPILRLARAAQAVGVPESPLAFSPGLLVTTMCEESAFPWARTAPAGERRTQLEAASRAIGDGPFAPFDRSVAIGISLMPACLGWPAAAAPPAFATAPAPAAPTLLLAGTRDLRTPLEDARTIAASLPDARLLPAVGVGHSVVTSNTSGCPEGAVARFLAGGPVRRACRRDRLLDLPPDPVAPAALAQVPPVAGLGGRRGRTVTAVLMTLGDLGASLLASLPDVVLEAVERGTLSTGGLRGGYATLDAGGISLRGVVYVPGVRVSGRVRFAGGALGIRASLRVDGTAAARGTLRVAPSGAVAGRLSGRRFRLGPSAVLAGTARSTRLARTLARLRALVRWRAGHPRLGRPPRLGRQPRLGSSPG